MESIDSQITKQTNRAGYALDFIRIFLGVTLFVRSIVFVMDQPQLMEMLEGGGANFLPTITAPYIILAHMAGGLMLIFGLLTRVAAVIQLPVLLGAILFINVRAQTDAADEGLELSILVFFLLCVFAAVGSGRLSIDHFLRDRQSKIMDDLVRPG